MSLRTKSASQINETDEVALMLAAKNNFQNNQSVEVKPARSIICAWFLAKFILATGKVDGCEAKLVGYAEKGKDGKYDFGRIVDDEDTELDEGISDEDFSQAKSVVIEGLTQREKQLAEREAAIERREKELLSKETQVVENPLKAVQELVKEGDQKGEVKTDSGATPPIVNPESSMKPNEGPAKPKGGKGIQA